MSAGGGTDRGEPRCPGRPEGTAGTWGRAGQGALRLVLASRPGLGREPFGLGAWSCLGGCPSPQRGPLRPAFCCLLPARCAASPLGSEPGRDGQLMEKGIAELRR